MYAFLNVIILLEYGMKRLKNFLMSFLLVTSMTMFAGDVLALPSTSALPADGSAPFALAEKDYFIGVLLKGFLGDIINTSSVSADTTIKGPGKLGEIFRTFNLGVAFFGTLLVLFITIIGVLQSGQDGEFLGKKWSSMWVPIRFALGSVLMLPLTASGYSFVQALVLWIALQGVGFADSIWATVVDTLVKRSTVAQIWGIIPAQSITRNMMSSAMCASAVTNFTELGIAPLKISFFPMSDVSSSNGMTTSSWRWGVYEAKPDSDNYAMCGKFSYTYQSVNGQSADEIANSAPLDKFANARAELIKTQKLIITEMGQEFNGFDATSNLVNALKSPDDAVVKTIQPLEDSINAKVYQYSRAYQARMTQSADDTLGKYGGTDQDAAAEKMKQYGFVAAGVFYIELARLNSAVTNQMSAVPIYTGPNVSSVNAFANGSTAFNTLFKYFETVNSDISQVALDAKAQKAAYASAGTAKSIDNGDIMPSVAEFAKSPSGAMDAMATSLSAKFVRFIVGVGPDSSGGSKLGLDRNLTTEQAKASNNTGSAILELKNRGDNILLLATGVFLAKAIADGAIGAAEGSLWGKAADLATGAVSAGKGFWSGLAPAILSVCGGLFAFGFTLAVYMPMVPYVLWIGGIVGLLVLIAESLVASALWAVMLIHPSGEGLTSDQSRQGVMMLLVLFSRPALMVMGMIMGMFMIDPLVMLVNDTFFFAMTNLQKGTGFTGLFSAIAFGVVYISLIISIINRCFSMIHTVPDRVLRWIGGGDAQLGESNARDDAKGMSSMAAGAVGGALGAGMSAMDHGKARGRQADTAAKQAAKDRKAAAKTSNNGSLLPKA